MKETQQLAAFARELRYEDIPAEVIDNIKDLVLDQLGCELGCSTLPWGKVMLETIQELGGNPQSTVVNFGYRTSADQAAFLNAAFGHSFELDDAHAMAMSHPGCVVIPAALAVGEWKEASGKDFLAAVVAGYEVMIRIGWAGSPYILTNGHHTPPAIGPFGAAAAAGKLLGLGLEEMVNSLAIAGSHAGGLLEYTQSRGSVKRIHVAIPAQAGIRSALFAQRGLTGPPTVIEGRMGFLAAFARTYDLKRLTDGLGEDYMLLGTLIKPYACCGGIHPAIDATRKILASYRVQPAQIQEVEVGLSNHQVKHVGTIQEPEDLLGAQFSTAFSLGMTVLKGGNGFKEYANVDLKDPQLLAFARRVSVVEDAEAEASHGRRIDAVVRIRTTDGRQYEERVCGAKGTPENPMTREEVQEKFRDLASLVLPAERVERVIETVERLERLDTLPELVKLLVK